MESIFENNKVEEFKGLLLASKHVVITTHHKPDADALGSSVGLHLLLMANGIRSTIVTPSDFPDFLDWMETDDMPKVEQYDEKKNAQHPKQLIEEADLILCLDFSNLGRLTKIEKIVEASKAKRVVIDHHLEPNMMSDLSFWDTKAAATAELIYLLAVACGWQKDLKGKVLEVLYAGIMTDTGSFRHPSTSARVHQIAADMIGLGLDNSKVHRLIYDNNSISRLKFLGFCLSEKLIILPDLHTAYISISKEELERYQIETGDTEGVVNYALSLKGIVMAAIIIDRTEAVKLSFRSLGNFSVNDFSKRHFSGGGHKNASGGISDKTLHQTVSHFLEMLPQHKLQLEQTFQDTV